MGTRHPYIVYLRFAFQTSKQFVLVMQYCAGGTLQDLIKRQKILSVEVGRHYAAEMLLALSHLHEQKVWHRDLKPENVLFDSEGHSMLTDFGLSKQDTTAANSKSFLGSVCYIAPEVLARKGHDHTVDIYGLGVLLHEMLTGKVPFFNKSRGTMWENIRKAPLVIPEGVPASAKALIEASMKKTPSERIGATGTAELKSHAFFEEVDFEAMMRRDLEVPKGGATTTVIAPDDATAKEQEKKPDARRESIFGRVMPCATVFKCLQSKRVDGWDFQSEAPDDSLVRNTVNSSVSQEATDASVLRQSTQSKPQA